MDANGVLDAMAWARDEALRRGADATMQMRAAHEMRRKLETGVSVEDAKHQTVEALKLAGLYLEGEETFERAQERMAKAAPTRGVVVFRSSGGPPVVWGPGARGANENPEA